MKMSCMDRLGIEPKDSSSKVKKPVNPKYLLVIKVENVDGENWENIASKVHQDTLLTQPLRSSRTTRPPQRYSPSLHYIILANRGELKKL